MRGYLWDNLRNEIEAEFETLVPPALTDDMMSEHVADDVRYSCWNSRELQRLPPDIRERLNRLVHAKAMAEVGRERRRLSRLEKPAGPKKRRSRVPPAPDKNQIQYAKRKMMRAEKERLPADREGVTHHFTLTAMVEGKIDEIKGYIIANSYADGRLGEIFVRVGPAGSSWAWLDQWSIAASMALQYGAPVDAFFKKFIATSFEPAGPTKCAQIPRCSSILDYVARWVLLKFGGPEAKSQVLAMAGSREVQP